jgi:3-dehydroquinate dehydratase-2
MKVKIINGPNLNVLGNREVEIYGTTSFESYFKTLQDRFSDLDLSYFQSNKEGEIISAVQEAADLDALIVNPAGYSHTSVAIADSLAMLSIPKIEVHISNIAARESYRHATLTGAKCHGVISGLGLEGYALALTYLKQIAR